MWEDKDIITLVGVILTFLLNIYQSVRQRHFEVDSGCCSMKYDSKHQEKNSESSGDELPL